MTQTIRKKWSKEEDAFVLANSNLLSNNDIAEKLGRTRRSVLHRKKYLSLNNVAPSKWTPEEDNFLKENYPLMSVKEISERMNRTQASIYHRIDRLGIRGNTKENKHWTNEELFLLEEIWGKVRLSAVIKRIGRSRNGILDQAVRIQRLGPTKYAQGFHTAKSLAELIGVTDYMVKKWITKCGLKAELKVTRGKKRFYQIDIKDFEEWAKINDWPRCERSDDI